MKGWLGLVFIVVEAIVRIIVWENDK